MGRQGGTGRCLIISYCSQKMVEGTYIPCSDWDLIHSCPVSTLVCPSDLSEKRTRMLLAGIACSAFELTLGASYSASDRSEDRG